MPPRDRTAERRGAVTERYYRYQAEARELLDESRGLADRGMWDEAAAKVNSAMLTMAYMTGVCREMHLLTTLAEER